MRRILVSAGLVAAVLTLVFLGIQAAGWLPGTETANVADAGWHRRLLHRVPSHHVNSATPTPTSTASPTPSPTPTTTAPATKAPAPAPAPSRGGYGVPAGTSLRDIGSMTVDQAGAVLDGLNVSGTITVTAANVTIKNSKFTGSGQNWAVRTDGGSVHIEDSTFTGNYGDAAISYHNWTATRIDISGMTNDGAKVGNNVTLTDSWIHDFKPEGGAHGDGLQVVEDVGNIVIKNNKIDIGKLTGVNAAIMLSPDIGPENPNAGPVTVDGNTLGGGGYTFYSVNGRDGASLQNVAVTNNRFVRDALFGPIYPSEFVAKSVSGNVFDDGQAVKMP